MPGPELKVLGPTVDFSMAMHLSLAMVDIAVDSGEDRAAALKRMVDIVTETSKTFERVAHELSRELEQLEQLSSSSDWTCVECGETNPDRKIAKTLEPGETNPVRVRSCGNCGAWRDRAERGQVQHG